MALQLLQPLMFLMAAAIAWRIGGEPEKRGSQILIFICLVGLFRRVFFGISTSQIDPIGLASDALSFIAFAAIAAFAWRFWPICAAALQLLAVMAHVVRGFRLEIDPAVYFVMRATPTFTLWLVVLIGALNHSRLKRVADNIPSWRSWSVR
jgi:hypothetical protein